MSASEHVVTRLSTKGQLILPKAVRERLAWKAGTQLLVEETPDGVLLKRASGFVETKPEDVFGVLPWHGKPVSLEEMDAAVLTEAKRRHAGD